MGEIFQEVLMEHFRFPKNRKKINAPDFVQEDSNPSCGDHMHIEGKVKNNIVVDLGFSATGCALSQATASMLTEKCIGMLIDDVLALKKDDIIALIGQSIGPVRLKCALLSLQVLQQGLLGFFKNLSK